ncbi:MAG: UbiX family flavin prenyltransferase, partial [Candidatus Thorarchaeota archaeon]|nr:UbiX family flavin prenyltransferase [Candidatus Thorarchaeota archaeon]
HEVCLIVSKWGAKTLEHEMELTPKELAKEVDCVFDNDDLSAGPASGSYHLDAMAIVPCSMKTLAGVAHGYAETLVVRAADCSLKEKRPLVLLPRETPLNLIHIKNMAQVVEAGATVIPASPAFWHKPKTIEELVDSLIDRILTHLHVKEKTEIEWSSGSSQ